MSTEPSAAAKLALGAHTPEPNLRPVEPPPSRWAFPDPTTSDPSGLVGLGADLEPGTLLAAYRNGLFPMPIGRTRLTRRLAWWSPDPRGVLPFDRLRVSRSLRKACAHFEVRVDTAFGAVLDACADPNRHGAWITPDIRDAYLELHRLGWAHSVEAWSLEDGTLAGGLYGVAVGGLFAGESMFHRRTDGSKVALVGLVQLLRDDGNDGAGRLLDVQWRTDHLASLGVTEVARTEYLERLRATLALPQPTVFGG